MIQLIYKTGSLIEKLEKIRIIDNMRTEIEKKAIEEVEFSNEAIIALSYFPKTDIPTFFGFVKGELKKGVDGNIAYAGNFQNCGYAHATFIVETETFAYPISDKELKEIGWTDAKEVPDFVIEVFTKLDCMPDEIINQ